MALRAHVDAGKLFLTEQLLYDFDAICKVESMYDGTAYTDFLEVERVLLALDGAVLVKADTGREFHTVPKPCWADLTLAMKPFPRGIGIAYASIVPLLEISYRY